MHNAQLSSAYLEHNAVYFLFILLFLFVALSTVEDGGYHENESQESDEGSHYCASGVEYIVVKRWPLIAAAAHEKESHSNKQQAHCYHYIIHLVQRHFFLYTLGLFSLRLLIFLFLHYTIISCFWGTIAHFLCKNTKSGGVCQ